MIIECPNCNKKFEVDSNLIPDDGRNIQCGSCNYVWFFKKKIQKKLDNEKIEEVLIKNGLKYDDNLKEQFSSSPKKHNLVSTVVSNKQNSTLTKSEDKSSFTLTKFLSYILVGIISFVILIIVLDTFKTPLYNFFPNLEFLLFNFFELIQDITLFIKDLI